MYYFSLVVRPARDVELCWELAVRREWLGVELRLLEFILDEDLDRWLPLQLRFDMLAIAVLMEFTSDMIVELNRSLLICGLSWSLGKVDAKLLHGCPRSALREIELWDWFKVSGCTDVECRSVESLIRGPELWDLWESGSTERTDDVDWRSVESLVCGPELSDTETAREVNAISAVSFISDNELSLDERVLAERSRLPSRLVIEPDRDLDWFKLAAKPWKESSFEDDIPWELRIGEKDECGGVWFKPNSCPSTPSRASKLQIDIIICSWSVKTKGQGGPFHFYFFSDEFA